jgi:hypothetical protein
MSNGGHGAALDRPTLLAVALAVYALVNVAHEGLGHGGACLLVGGRPLALNAVYFECGEDGLSALAQRLVSAGGTLVNLALGAVGALRLSRARAGGWGRYALWLFTTLNLLQATGYWLFSGLGNVGDWAAVTAGVEPHALARVTLALAGGLGYAAAVAFSLRQLARLLGAEAASLERARELALVPYLAGGCLYVVAGLLNPVDLRLVLISAAAASFGGASALAWMTELLRDGARYPRAAGDEPLPRSLAWLAAGGLAAALFVGVLGRSVWF